MGILNVTPDSFSDGGKFVDISLAVAHAREMIAYGADIVDIGGESTRPGAEKISADEELSRVIPVIVEIRKQLGPDITLSIDTYKAIVAKEAVTEGVNIINDVSGLQLDKEMPKVVAEVGVPVIINHMRGIPKTMQEGKITYNDVIQDISNFFIQQIALLEKYGVSKDAIILDPGFGFGKTVEQNIEMIQRLGEFKKFHRPLLIGVSRKSTIEKILSEELDSPVNTEERLEGSLAAMAGAVLHGANIVRVHDILETRKFLAVLDRIKI